MLKYERNPQKSIFEAFVKILKLLTAEQLKTDFDELPHEINKESGLAALIGRCATLPPYNLSLLFLFLTLRFSTRQKPFKISWKSNRDYRDGNKVFNQ